MAKACSLSHKNPKFFYLAASSRDYGLTTGSRDTETIALTELGNSIVYPESAEKQRQDKINAFFTVKMFKDVFDHYGGGTLPEREFVSSVLYKKFGLDDSLHDEFCDLYKKNCKYLSIMDGLGGLQAVKVAGQATDGAVVLPAGPVRSWSLRHHALLRKGEGRTPGGFL